MPSLPFPLVPLRKPFHLLSLGLLSPSIVSLKFTIKQNKIFLSWYFLPAIVFFLFFQRQISIDIDSHHFLSSTHQPFTIWFFLPRFINSAFFNRNLVTKSNGKFLVLNMHKLLTTLIFETSLTEILIPPFPGISALQYFLVSFICYFSCQALKYWSSWFCPDSALSIHSLSTHSLRPQCSILCRLTK